MDSDGPERLVKDQQRVRDLGEVFTPAAVVQNMLDLLPEPAWQVHPAMTFLEPACGDGNFLVAILDRKLDAVTRHATTPDGKGRWVLHALEALASIYAVDISADNVLGGGDLHGPGARERMLTVFAAWTAEVTGTMFDPQSPMGRSARWIVEHNVQVGNMLATNADGSSSGRDQLPLVEYTWDPAGGKVQLATTTLGAVMQEAQERTSATISLFGAPAPQVVWSGPAPMLFEAKVAGRGRVSRAGGARR